MGKMKATLPDYPTVVEYKYDVPPSSVDNKWAMEIAVRVCGPLDSEPRSAYFARLKEYAKEIINTLNSLNYDDGNMD
jgi:hypothetical protein